MIIEKIIPYSHTLIERSASEGDIVVDATVGNGHDTLFLAKLVGKGGKVFGFDIQKEAITRTEKLMKENDCAKQTSLFNTGHENLKECIPAIYHGKITAAIFNLGYLPKSDRRIVTKPETTIKAVHDLLDIAATGGIIVLVVYPGHPGGREEKEDLLGYVSRLDQRKFSVLQYQFINQRNNPPFVIAIEKYSFCNP